MRGSSATVSIWPYDLIQGTNNPSMATSFTRNLPFFLPLLLKSLATRCCRLQTTSLIIPMTFLDDSHMQILVPLIETIAIGTMREAMSGSSGVSNAEQMLSRALSTTQYSIEFLIGTFTCLHPSQVSILINAYFDMLDECENPVDIRPNVAADDRHNIRRVKCAKLIRLHAVEMLAVMPRFIALNYPPKYDEFCPKKNTEPSTWTSNSTNRNNPSNNNWLQTYLEKIDRYPQSFWLADLLMDQCLSISLGCCTEIVDQANAQLKSTRYVNKISSHLLSPEDLLGLEAISLQAVSCAYNLLIKRHAIDARFQTIESNTRVAAMFVDSVLDTSVIGVSVLSKLGATHKVRCHWILCLLYALQESPEVLLRDKLRSFCQPNVSLLLYPMRKKSPSNISHQYHILNLELSHQRFHITHINGQHHIAALVGLY